ncbi:fructosamine kinase family protein [Schleiferia thermophila]|jgi:fructosamine-3-kinase|uniref:Fructosamine-3-kinase n=1 Tax=Schleiferia thermophila TaxID=884107 RepID=A0A369A3N7_9FLAO|nr:fructosamine kinase family protein [Schleiferia thermophila]KFD38722.1 hypothetical protein AT05_08760 [Schleiferia thermophila str. Yellowstone]RCX02064.1 fructosamine-3-kinase [Schleiferia thermophila]GCD80587.1 fructosamine kinase [Schleiferia thermophila]
MIRNEVLESIAVRVKVPKSQLSFEPVHGGCIGQSYKLITRDGGSYFLKTTSEKAPGDFFAKEAEGLRLLQDSGLRNVPTIIAVDRDFLILSWVNQGVKTQTSLYRAGESLAILHSKKYNFYGLEHPNYIGSEPQVNGIFKTWHECYFHSKLWPMALRANSKGHLSSSVLSMLERLEQKLPALLPEEHPSLLHGDLWGGNLMVSEEGEPYFIDPAVYYGHREVDLAMTMLFGGFGQSFYEAYQSSNPLLSDFKERVSLYQLYPLLVHAAIFGLSYPAECVKCIRQYL